MQNSISFIARVATVALIVIATRWLFGAKGASLPRTRDGSSIYGIKWQWRAIGTAGGVFWIIVSIWSWHDRHSRPDGVLIGITVAFLAVGLWIASGSVITNQTGITKRVLWRSLSLAWKDITEVRLHNRQGGAIELRAGPKKLVIDSRFIGFQHLLNEIEDRTQLRPVGGGRKI
jgi:hypothetical protein